MSNLITKVNFTTKQALGSVGRPMVTGALVGAGTFAAGNYFDVEAMTNPYVVAGVALVTVAATEGLFYFAGDDTALQVKEAVEMAEEISKLSESQYTLLTSEITEKLGDSGNDVIDKLNALRTVAQAESIGKKQKRVS